MKTSTESISVYEAIAQMRLLSSKGIPFSFSHATWDNEKLLCNGMRHVQNAILRPAASTNDIKNADLKLFYTDRDLKENRNCWQPLIMFFNGIQCYLN